MMGCGAKYLKYSIKNVFDNFSDGYYSITTSGIGHLQGWQAFGGTSTIAPKHKHVTEPTRQIFQDSSSRPTHL